MLYNGNIMPVTTDFLVVQLSSGMPAVFPGHANHEGDERLARQVGYKILQRCPDKQEAHAIMSRMIKEGVANGSL